jgi:hypothetical protein
MKAFWKYKAALTVTNFQKILHNTFLSIRKRFNKTSSITTLLGFILTLVFMFVPELFNERVTHILAFISISLFVTGVVWAFFRIVATAIFVISIPLIFS